MNKLHINPFIGQHCESTALVNLLNQRGIHLSESLVFGLGQGLGYIYWKSKGMDFPFLGGRVKPDELTENLGNALNLSITCKETGSVRKAWNNLTDEIDAGNLVALKLDSHYLDYCKEDFHFAAHYVTCYGYDDKQVYLVDSMSPNKENTTSIANLEKARNYKGPMASKNLSFSIQTTETKQDLSKIIPESIMRKAKSYLNPPIQNMSFKGIFKTSEVMVDWLDTVEDPQKNLPAIGLLMEQAGTGGGLFRKLWAKFLEESAELTGNKTYLQCANQYYNISEHWSHVAYLIEKAGKTMTQAPLKQASSILAQLSIDEKLAMEKLYSTSSN